MPNAHALATKAALRFGVPMRVLASNTTNGRHPSRYQNGQAIHRSACRCEKKKWKSFCDHSA